LVISLSIFTHYSYSPCLPAKYQNFNPIAFKQPFHFYTGHTPKIYPCPGNNLKVDYDCLWYHSTVLYFSSSSMSHTRYPWKPWSMLKFPFILCVHLTENVHRNWATFFCLLQNRLKAQTCLLSIIMLLFSFAHICPHPTCVKVQNVLQVWHSNKPLVS
jgi:hypothetical protein